MSGAGFDPLELTADASLNHVILGDVGCPEIAGMRAEEVCSRDAFLSLATEYGLSWLRRDRLADDLAAAAASADMRIARAADAAVATFGDRLGALVATLRDPRTPEAQGHSPGRRAFLAHWLTVDSVWFAGGLLGARFRPTIMACVRAHATAAVRPCRVALAPHPAVAPLLGAARYAASAGRVIAVADLGHTSVKTAVAECGPTALQRLRLLDTYPAPSTGSPDEVGGAVAELLVEAVKRAKDDRSDPVPVVVSVASYVVARASADRRQGIYGGLAARPTWLQERVTAGSGAEVTLEFVHDGTAAACTVDAPNSATITAGTWLGVGFRPADAPPLAALAPDLSICHS